MPELKNGNSFVRELFSPRKNMTVRKLILTNQKEKSNV